MEKFGGQKKHFESVPEHIEDIELDKIAGSDILVGDRAFIVTISGNRYMLRRSKSNGDRLMVYNEREGGFSPESGRLLGLPKGQQVIAEKGKIFEAYAIDDPQKMTGGKFSSTPVAEIRLFRGLDTYAESKPKDETGSFGRFLAQQMGKVARGKKTDFE